MRVLQLLPVQRSFSVISTANFFARQVRIVVWIETRNVNDAINWRFPTAPISQSLHTLHGQGAATGTIFE